MGIAGIGTPRRWRMRNSAYVFGITCINPIAPFCETARASPKLSTRITARIQLSGMLNRCAASVTKTAKGREAGGQAGRPRSAGSRPRTAGRSSRKQKDRHDTNRDLKQRAAPGAVPPALELRRSVPSRRLVAAGRLHLSSARAGGKEGSDKSLGGRTHRVRIAHRRHVHSSSAVRWVQREAARPIIEAAGNGPKYARQASWPTARS
jgi:hypothetical protein